MLLRAFVTITIKRGDVAEVTEMPNAASKSDEYNRDLFF